MMLFRNLMLSVAAVVLANGAQADDSVLVQAPVEKIFVPSGFDDNDKIEVVVHGHFTSTCYKMGPVSASVDETTKKITLTAQAFYYRNTACIQLMTPFVKSVELDRHLPVGTYSISIANNTSLPPVSLRVAKATRADADDYLYAAVQTANVEYDVDGARQLVLKGQHPFLIEGCAKFDAVKSYVGEDGTVVVLPITKIVYGDECRGSVNNRFEYRTRFGGAMEAGEYLLHVRVLDGNAINQFLEIHSR